MTSYMADGLLSQAITVVVSERIECDVTHCTCDCCSQMLKELSEVKNELSSCKEVIRILQDDLQEIYASHQSLVNKASDDPAHKGLKTLTSNEDWSSNSSKRRNYSKVVSREPSCFALATYNQFDPLTNLKDRTDHLRSAPLVKRSLPVYDSKTKRPPMQSRTKKTREVKQKIVILGDSHTRNCAAGLQHAMGKDVSVIGLVKPGAGMGQIVNAVSDEIKNLKGDDVLIIGGGSNDIYKNNSNQALSHLSAFIINNQVPNIVVMTAPPRHDLHPTSCINCEVNRFKTAEENDAV